MFVGHGLLAFALVAFLGKRRGCDRAVVLSGAVLAGLFGMLPDVDVVYGLLGVLLGPVAVDPESFWAVSNEVHRGFTHSVPVGLLTASGAGLLARRDGWKAAGLAILTGVVVIAFTVSGGVAGLVAVVFVAGVVALVTLGRRLALSPQMIASVALVGAVSHPFGDLFTGSPPDVLYPFDAVLIADRVVLAADPTMHLLAAFGLELATVWLAVGMYFRVIDRTLLEHVDRRAALGVAYGGTAFVLPAPTLEVSYHFVFSVLGVGVIGVVQPSVRRVVTWRSAVTALATISIAVVAYAIVYHIV